MTPATNPSPPSRTSPLRRACAFILLSAIVMVVAIALDPWTYQHLNVGDYNIDNRDWARLLRITGYIPTWIIIALALHLALPPSATPAAREHARRRTILFILAPTLAGLAGEIIKLIVRRERPTALDGFYSFRPLSDGPLSSGDLGFPSTHAAVAFAAAWVLCRLYPRAAPLWLALALGCALTRVLEQAHFLSDVTAAALISYAVVQLLPVRARASSAEPADPAP